MFPLLVINTYYYKMQYRYENITINSIYDGDTLTVTLHIGFKIDFTTRLRLYGINTWEVRGKEREKGIIARDWLRARLEGKQVAIQTIKDKKGKYGRYLAIIFVKDGDKWTDVNQELLGKGHGVSFMV